MVNPIVFWELASHDAEKSKQFFEKVFGWIFNRDEGIGIYTTHTEHGQSGMDGGLLTLRRAKLPFLTLYIQVEDIHAKADLVKKYGGFVVEEPFEINSGSKICLFNEPSGVTFALLEKKQ